MKSIVNVWYLYNSGFAIETKSSILIFDYYLTTPPSKPSPCIDTVFLGGIVDINVLIQYAKSKPIYILASHSHYDHYTPKVLKWDKTIKINYILSYDIQVKKMKDNIYKVNPDSTVIIDDLEIKSLDSNDEGVAFVVHVDGLTIFHSGDLNWWYWPEEGYEWNNEIEVKYKSEIEKLKNIHIDLAFIPVDPRLDDAYDWSLKYFIHNLKFNNTIIFPMHFGEDYSIFEKIHSDNSLNNIPDIKNIQFRGQVFSLEL